MEEDHGPVLMCIEIKNNIQLASSNSISLSLTSFDCSAALGMSHQVNLIVHGDVVHCCHGDDVHYFSGKLVASAVFWLIWQLCLFMYLHVIYISLFAAGIDYSEISTVLLFNSNNQLQCVSFEILNDNIPENDEHFCVTLTSNEPSGSVIVDPSSAIVTIIDEDGKKTNVFLLFPTATHKLSCHNKSPYYAMIVRRFYRTNHDSIILIW